MSVYKMRAREIGYYPGTEVEADSEDNAREEFEEMIRSGQVIARYDTDLEIELDD